MRRDKLEIDLQIINEVMDKKVLGSASTRLPDSPAKRRLALIAAAKAVVIALTPGMPQLQRVTIRPRGDSVSRTLFMPQASHSPGLDCFWQARPRSLLKHGRKQFLGRIWDLPNAVNGVQLCQCMYL